MAVKNIYETIKQVIQDVVAPELREISGELKLIHTEIRRLDEKIDNVRNELGTKIIALDEKISSLREEFGGKFNSVRDDLRNLREEFKLAIDIHERLAAVEAKLSR